MKIPDLKPFRLVGGTALSLLFGHRSSIDLDLFTDVPFNKDELSYQLSESFSSLSFQEIKSPRLFFTYINNVKVDFVNTFEKFIHDVELKDEIRFASIEDIIALKLNAIAGRGAKKDFWDIYELLNHHSFEKMIEAYQERYPNNSLMMVLKSMTYFVEADMQPDPDCFKKLKWEKIKKEITQEINTYINDRN